MAELIRVGSRVINMDAVCSIELKACDPDNGIDDAVLFEFSGDDSLLFFGAVEVEALRIKFNDIIDEVARRALQIERNRISDCLKRDVCPDCGSALGARHSELDGQCSACDFNKWA